MGTEGVILHQHTAGPQWLPKAKYQTYERPKPAPRDHYRHFVDACLGGEKTESNFAQTGPMTETILLGTVAIRRFGQKLTWGAAAMKFPNCPEAERYRGETFYMTNRGWRIMASDGADVNRGRTGGRRYIYACLLKGSVMNVEVWVTRSCAPSGRLFSAFAGVAVGAAIVSGCWVTPAANRALAAESPRGLNIVFVLADDLGWADLGCYGGTFYESPHIDRLATGGNQVHPGLHRRIGLLADAVEHPDGQVPGAHGHYRLHPGPASGRGEAGHALHTPRTGAGGNDRRRGLAKQGYQTFYTGKWHLGGKGFEPQDQGYEAVVDDASLGNTGQDPLVGDRLTESALKFLDTRDKTRPFFMFLGYHEPHTPILAHPKYIDHFRTKAAQLPKPDRENEREHRGQSRLVQDDPAYACEVAVLDDGVKRLSEKLDALGLTGTTVFVFTSDNGGLCTKAQAGPTSNLPLRSGKGWLYEGGIARAADRAPARRRAARPRRATRRSSAPTTSPRCSPWPAPRRCRSSMSTASASRRCWAAGRSRRGRCTGTIPTTTARPGRRVRPFATAIGS